jgi:hypothetical protein
MLALVAAGFDNAILPSSLHAIRFDHLEVDRNRRPLDGNLAEPRLSQRYSGRAGSGQLYRVPAATLMRSDVVRQFG